MALSGLLLLELGLYASGFVCGIITAESITIVQGTFGGRCMLYGLVNYNVTAGLIGIQSTSSSSLCHFTTAISVMVAVVCFLVTLYWLYRLRINGEFKRDHICVNLIIAVSSFFLFFLLITGCVVNLGRDTLCNSIIQSVPDITSCEEAQTRKWVSPIRGRRFFNSLYKAETAVWVNCFFWLIILVLVSIQRRRPANTENQRLINRPRMRRRHSIPTWREQSTGFRQTTTASDLAVLTLIPTASHELVHCSMAPMTFRPQLLEAASKIEAFNMVHSDSMSPTSLRMCEKFFQRWELKTSRAGSSTRFGLSGTLMSNLMFEHGTPLTDSKTAGYSELLLGTAALSWGLNMSLNQCESVAVSVESLLNDAKRMQMQCRERSEQLSMAATQLRVESAALREQCESAQLDMAHIRRQLDDLMDTKSAFEARERQFIFSYRGCLYAGLYPDRNVTRRTMALSGLLLLELGLYASGFFCGIVTAASIIIVQVNFGGRCMLYGLVNYNVTAGLIGIELPGSPTLCHFVTTMSIMVAVVCFLVCLYCLYTLRIGGEIKRDHICVNLIIAVSSFFLFFLLITGCVLKIGRDTLCNSIIQNVHDITSCEEAQTRKWVSPISGERFYNSLYDAETAAWVNFFLWLIIGVLVIVQSCQGSGSKVIRGGHRRGRRR
ncbi:uncharacterized protein [Cebidichthys violaceus]|uniref:uncharacterized protein n=1 Tax=Cebidichthys violaceus TaxID=271503 RepID=UPI0035CAEFCA